MVHGGLRRVLSAPGLLSSSFICSPSVGHGNVIVNCTGIDLFIKHFLVLKKSLTFYPGNFKPGKCKTRVMNLATQPLRLDLLAVCTLYSSLYFHFSS